MRPIAIIDIDTTLANNDHRAVLLERHCSDCGLPVGNEHRPICKSCGSEKSHTPQEKWDQFLDPKLMALDTPQPHALDVIETLRSRDWYIVFMTGRNAKHRPVTERWLREHMLWRSDRESLIMRPLANTGIPASQMKEKMFLEFRDNHRLEKNPFFFFEDDRYVLGTWQKYGLVFLCPQAWEYMNPEVHDRAVEPVWNR